MRQKKNRRERGDKVQEKWALDRLSINEEQRQSFREKRVARQTNHRRPKIGGNAGEAVRLNEPPRKLQGGGRALWEQQRHGKTGDVKNEEVETGLKKKKQDRSGTGGGDLQNRGQKCGRRKEGEVGKTNRGCPKTVGNQ